MALLLRLFRHLIWSDKTKLLFMRLDDSSTCTAKTQHTNLTHKRSGIAWAIKGVSWKATRSEIPEGDAVKPSCHKTPSLSLPHFLHLKRESSHSEPRSMRRAKLYFELLGDFEQRLQPPQTRCDHIQTLTPPPPSPQAPLPPAMAPALPPPGQSII